MTKFICVCGKAQHGKDTTAGLLKTALEKQGKRVLIMHYADLLKFICKQYFGWDGKKDDHGRTLLQQVGTEGVRSQRPDFWVDFVVDVVTLFPNEWDYVIVPDTRFPNEVERPREAGFPTMLVRVTRPDFDNGLSEEQKAHKSEIALDDVIADYYLLNTTLDNLKGQIDDMCGQMIVLERLDGFKKVKCQECGEYLAPFELDFDEEEREPKCPLCGGLVDLPEGM